MQVIQSEVCAGGPRAIVRLLLRTANRRPFRQLVVHNTVVHNHAKWFLQQTQQHQNAKDVGTKIPSQSTTVSLSLCLCLGLESEGLSVCLTSQLFVFIVVMFKSFLFPFLVCNSICLTLGRPKFLLGVTSGFRREVDENCTIVDYYTARSGRLLLKCDGTCEETRFRLSAKRASPFKSAGASVQLTNGSRGVRISGSNTGYTMFRGSVKGTGYTLHSPVSPSLLTPCVTLCHHISTGL